MSEELFLDLLRDRRARELGAALRALLQQTIDLRGDLVERNLLARLVRLRLGQAAELAQSLEQRLRARARHGERDLLRGRIFRRHEVSQVLRERAALLVYSGDDPRQIVVEALHRQ